MIPFFRKIRRDFAHQGKSSKYLRYAIGEIVLVVFGILIALQINNWNESQKNRRRSVQQLQTIAENLEEDILQLEDMKQFTDTTLLYAHLLSRQLQTLNPIDSLTSKYMLWLVLEKQTNPNKSGYETLSNSEALGNIPLEIKELLFKYYNGLDNIKAREEISNTFIKNRYEPYFFEHYHHLISKHTKWNLLNDYYKYDPRERRYFQIEQQNTLYDGTKELAHELLQNIRAYH